MQRVRSFIHMDAVEKEQLTGAGIGVGVLDSGVVFHDDLEGRIAMYKDFTKGARKELRDETGHGTHVCGIIAGNGKCSQGKYRGMAPGCQLYIGKILNDRGEGDVDTLIRGLEWLLLLAQTLPIKVINISVSSLYFSKEGEKQHLFSLLRKAWEANLLIVTAAGNSGPGGKTVSKLGDSPHVICVGCHEGKQSAMFEKRCQDCSGRGPGELVYRKPDLVAPGTEIMSCAGRNHYVKKSGTSMATPIVSGALALAFEKNPELSSWEMKRKLIYATDDLGENFLMQGFGMINVEKLLRR